VFEKDEEIAETKAQLEKLTQKIKDDRSEGG